MTYAIRHALVALPLGLILSGCAGPQRTESSYNRASQPSARAGVRPVARVVDRSDELPVYVPAGSAATDTQHDITLEQIRGHVREKTAVVIDARSPELFARAHVTGAINVPAGEIGSYFSQVEQTVGRGRLIIIYCGGPTCGAGDMVYEYLTDRGYTNMRVYKPGWQQLAMAKTLQ